MYKISSPLNFRADPNIKHGSIKYFSKIPEWANNNPCIVIEQEQQPIESSNLGKREENSSKKPKEKLLRKCKYCNYSNISLKRLKKHYLTKHKGRKDKKNKI